MNNKYRKVLNIIWLSIMVITTVLFIASLIVITVSGAIPEVPLAIDICVGTSVMIVASIGVILMSVCYMRPEKDISGKKMWRLSMICLIILLIYWGLTGFCVLISLVGTIATIMLSVDTLGAETRIIWVLATVIAVLHLAAYIARIALSDKAKLL